MQLPQGGKGPRQQGVQQAAGSRGSRDSRVGIRGGITVGKSSNWATVT